MTITYNTPDRPAFIRKQYAFAAYIRDPENHPRPDDVEARRMKIYRELFYNNVESYLADTYPVLRKIMPDSHWHAIIRTYFSRHLSQTPLFPEMPREFLKYLEQTRAPHPDDPVFMLELAHYEWAELALSILDKEVDESTINSEDNLLESRMIISPLAWLLSYRFPVHKISPEFQPKEADENLTHLVVYRDRDDHVRFIEANPVTARLIQLIIAEDEKTGRELLEQIAAELKHPQSEVVVSHGLDILNNLRNRHIIFSIGT
ncbi:hypothetical protein SAMN05216419_105410 [Nitrosomonas cryotolerans]|uniref:Uncharacterized protein n=1 Tax=Nitrosomonas cryotolerans ATCC 49181 TaxID=1131553 RepID=A0A1N6HEZ8_9PROT|nr:putative DNA-binding domain-containing protein [Nitrosomonas cryotolerans]SFQ06644.1 hypothetical protein SAMN05216419_105410 [Nitrosomonas cryotolerans]SIO18418.1 hypothetical protein SAMN02743940_1155 [Nitrosomonas cryotolerans ATCC 49181]